MSEELPPIRCVTCSKILGYLWKDYQRMIEDGESIEIALNKLGLSRPCCRIRLMNPFKTVDRSPQTQADVERMFSKNFDNLSLASNPEVPTVGALSALTSVTQITVVPEEEEEISLPPLPSFSSFPTPSSSKTDTTRTYRAW